MNGSPPTGPRRHRPGRTAWVLTILASTMALGCVGAAGGAGAGWLTSRPGDATLPPAAAGFPTAAALPLFDPDQTVSVLIDHGYECEETDGHPFDCSLSQDLDDPILRVFAELHDPAGVRVVTVTCSTTGPDCAEPLPLAVDAVLAGHPEQVREQAGSWVREHAADTTTVTTTLAEVQLVKRVYRSHTELRIGAA